MTIELPPALHIDLNSKRGYGNGHAVKNNMDYGYEGTYPTKIREFYYYKKICLLYPIIADKTIVDEVKRSNYVIVKDVKKIAKEREIIDIWHDDGFKGYFID